MRAHWRSPVASSLLALFRVAKLRVREAYSRAKRGFLLLSKKRQQDRAGCALESRLTFLFVELLNSFAYKDQRLRL